MLKWYLSICILTVSVFTGLPWGLSHDFQAGQTVTLQAIKPIGVPIHRIPGPGYWKHIPDGASGIIEEISDHRQHWLRLHLESGESAWVHSRYVRPGLSGPADSASHSVLSEASGSPDGSTLRTGGESTVWADREQCRTSLAQGLRMALPSDAHVRVATWNLRWFPVGQPPDQSERTAEPTDLVWLTCAIRWMQLDILAIQELLATPEATQALDSLTKALTTQTGRSWRWHRQPCGHPDDHHIGFLWDDSRVSLTNFDTLWQFNAKAEHAGQPCTYGLRPGQYAYVQSRIMKEVDFHLIALHLKSGPTVFDVEERHKALNRINQALEPFLNQDHDVLIVGDLNTMGAGDRHSQTYEIKNLRRHLDRKKPGFTVLEPQYQCSQYFRGQGGWLDHVLVSRTMEEMTVTAAVTGYCAVAGCNRIRGNYPLAYRHLSDHCPVVATISKPAP